jgi:hypothetical protein
MTEAKLDRLGPLMNEIGAEGASIVNGNPDGLYIYAEPNGGSVYAAVFKDDGTVVRYFDPTDELVDLIVEAWEIEDSSGNRRWAVMEYEVLGTKFDVKLDYPEDLDPAQHSSDRRRAALKKRYGDKPVLYPPMPELEK